ncbi:MAG: peptidoglycan-binding protein [Deltaproteobacteria bacterium]|nr:peptidoglycan-binding protein [Deltaproteobacteria bacterium]
MSTIWTVLLLSLLPGVGNFLGGMVAEAREPSPRLLNWSLHAASGIVVAIVAVELMPNALDDLAGWWVALAFSLGGLAYVVVETVVGRLQRKQDSGDRSRMWMIYAAVAVDLTSDGLMIGSGAAVSSSLALILAAGQVLADAPEGYATMANFRAEGISRPKRLLLSLSFFIYVVGSAVGSYFLLRDAPNEMKMAGLVFVAGLLTVAAVEDMLEEAHEAYDDSRRSVLAFIGGFALFTLVSAGVGEVAGR